MKNKFNLSLSFTSVHQKLFLINSLYVKTPVFCPIFSLQLNTHQGLKSAHALQCLQQWASCDARQFWVPLRI